MTANPSKPRHTPVQSFGPHVMAALMKGALDGFRVPMPYNRAIRFRQRIYMLRAAMREEKHDAYTLVARVSVSVSWPKTEPILTSSRGVSRPQDKNTLCTVEIAPNDSEYAEDLRAVGVVPQLIDPSAVGPNNASQPSIDDLLSELKE